MRWLVEYESNGRMTTTVVASDALAARLNFMQLKPSVKVLSVVIHPDDVGRLSLRTSRMTPGNVT